MPKCGVCCKSTIGKDINYCYFCMYAICDSCINIQYSIYVYPSKTCMAFLCSFNCILKTIKYWSTHYSNGFINHNSFTTNNDIQIYDKIMKRLNKKTKLLLSEYICKDNQNIVMEYIR